MKYYDDNNTYLLIFDVTFERRQKEQMLHSWIKPNNNSQLITLKRQ